MMNQCFIEIRFPSLVSHFVCVCVCVCRFVFLLSCFGVFLGIICGQQRKPAGHDYNVKDGVVKRSQITATVCRPISDVTFPIVGFSRAIMNIMGA